MAVDAAASLTTIKRKSQKTVPSHCFTCGVCMSEMACSIDWHAVHVSNYFKDFMIAKGRLPSEDELSKMDESVGHDPCEDCCCGACGSRKSEPGKLCC